MSNTITQSSDTPLKSIIDKITKKHTLKYRNSVLHKTIMSCASLGLPISPAKILPKSKPPWHLQSDAIDTHLSQYKKATTSMPILRKEFLDIKSKLTNYTFIYTDASQNQDTTAYAITTENIVLKRAILPNYTSVYTAEIIAILEATEIGLNNKGKICICSDSLSAIHSILNIDNSAYYPTKIRGIINNAYPKIKILWVPSHVGISGNEFADEAAKNATIAPLITTHNINQSDINRFLKKHFCSTSLNLFQYSSSWYQSINSNHLNISDYTKAKEIVKLTRKDQTRIIRLRLGHTRLTHEFRLLQATDNPCKFCNNNSMSIDHILNECTAFNYNRTHIPNNNLTPLLSNPTTTNLLQLLDFLKKSNLLNLL